MELPQALLDRHQVKRGKPMNEIERLNALESAGLQAGQKLRVPVVSD